MKATMRQVNTAVLILTAFCFITSSGQANEAVCDTSICRGPIRFYEELKCKPVYKTPDSCCPYKYDCDHLKNRTTGKCYVNDHEYNTGEQLRKEDARPCDIGCTCIETLGVARFRCAVVDCFHGMIQPGCYLRHGLTRCCPEIVCEDTDKRPKCEVDGKIYSDGEGFTPASEPNKTCICTSGFANEYVEPFCRVNTRSCGVELRHAYEIHNKCVPTFYSSQSPQNDCSVAYRCQNSNDEVIKESSSTDNPDETDDMTCEFGSLIMKYGDQLTQATDYSSVCMNCTCEVGPLPTCQRLPDDDCDITKHKKFDDFS